MIKRPLRLCLFALSEWEVIKKKKGCPAVTLTTKVQSVEVSLDIVLCLMVKSSWPLFANDGLKIEGWLGTKVRKAQRLNSYYLVPKYEGQGTVTHNGVLTKGKGDPPEPNLEIHFKSIHVATYHNRRYLRVLFL